METIVMYCFKFKWHIIYLISGFIYCYSLNETNKKLLFLYAEDDYSGMLKNDGATIISSFLVAILFAVALAFLAGYTIRNYYLFMDDLISIIIILIIVIITINLIGLIIHLIYIPIFKAIMFGLAICGIIGAIMSD